MELITLESLGLVERSAGWLAEKRNRQWLDSGTGGQQLGPMGLKLMSRSDNHILRAFTADDTGEAIGLVALSSVNRDFRSALLWALLGDRSYAAKGYVFRATSAMLTLGFADYGLECINAWAVECNHASLRILRKLNFKPIGRQRGCHYIDGHPFDRLLFELQSSDHRMKPELAHKHPFTF
ncbi:MAG TPA: GNAT family protein [Gammaproteobacteria bacterium]|jgi:RimJ/RimL family protein N-acetyltransferase